MTHYSITNTDTNETIARDLNTPLRPAYLLPVPYSSQVQAGAGAHTEDCGAASGLMLLKAYNPDTILTVDQFYNEANPGGEDIGLSNGQIISVLTAHGLSTERKQPFDDGQLFECLRQRKPVIALIHCGPLFENHLTEFNFTKAHFVVIVGMDAGYIYIHDPYHDDNKGEAVAVPIDVFWQAWDQAGLDNNNPVRSGFYPIYPIGEVPFTAPLYKIKELCPNYQRVRNGPGENFDVVDSLANGKIVGVYEEKNGYGRISTNLWVYLFHGLNKKVD